MRKHRIFVLMGGPSVEHDVSLATGRVILNALDKNKYDARPIIIPKKGGWALPQEKADVVFIAMHGAFGEDGRVQGLLEFAGVPYTGSGVLASALAMDKIKSSEIFSHHGLKIPQYIVFTKTGWKNKREIENKIKNSFGFPCVIKPSDCGSSVGVSVVRKIGDLNRAAALAFSHSDTIMAQKYIKGAEVTCAVLDEGGNKEAIALPPTEIIPKTAEFFDYRAKYTVGASEEITPPKLPKEIIKKIQSTALKAHKVIGCSGMSRTDMIVSGRDIFVLEINTIPGMTETSLYPQAAAAMGISFPRLLDKIIQAAMNRKKG